MGCLERLKLNMGIIDFGVKPSEDQKSLKAAITFSVQLRKKFSLKWKNCFCILYHGVKRLRQFLEDPLKTDPIFVCSCEIYNQCGDISFTLRVTSLSFQKRKNCRQSTLTDIFTPVYWFSRQCWENFWKMQLAVAELKFAVGISISTKRRVLLK